MPCARRSSNRLRLARADAHDGDRPTMAGCSRLPRNTIKNKQRMRDNTRASRPSHFTRKVAHMPRLTGPISRRMAVRDGFRSQVSRTVRKTREGDILVRNCRLDGVHYTKLSGQRQALTKAY